MPYREDVLQAIEEERNYQEGLPADRRALVAKRTAEYLTLLSHYVFRAQERWSGRSGERAALHEVRKIAALAVACLEDNGCPRRGEA
jgi:hypothetical protein